MPPAHRTRRAGGAKRIAVLDAVGPVLAERGYENTRFADVSAATGVAISTLQNYFGSREDMMIEAMRRYTDQEIVALDAAVTTGQDPWGRLVALIDRSLGNSGSTRQVLIEFWRAGMRDEELREYSLEVQHRYREPFVRAVADGRDQGFFTLVHSPDEIVDFLLVSLVGFMIPQVLQHPTPTAEGFRRVLLSQIRLAVGLQP
ncbi:TetR/AcrR family transcriptional regulator [Streptomyces sp. NBC_01190]|uniref:TetR/AcrR family transcriptional regulator n=1 Tax=Streptomyces sp. NBC_01190 TaxID=2903767 RepID=UPI00386F524D|nr:TetR/AcrR family transcriptional regulator [Streptomyces sp. NBC_01190]